MSIQLLDKTRKINRLLNDKHSSKVAFADICFVLGQMLLANAYIISSKGKLLGTYVMRSIQEESDIEQHKKSNFSSALTTLTPLEQKAVSYVFHAMGGEDGTLVTSKLAGKLALQGLLLSMLCEN